MTDLKKNGFQKKNSHTLRAYEPLLLFLKKTIIWTYEVEGIREIWQMAKILKNTSKIDY